MPFIPGQNIVVREIDDSHWELVEPITYQGNTDTWTIEPGFKTDFASVPRPLVWLIPRYGRYTKAAILHDFLWITPAVSRADANGVFRRAMRELGVPFVRRWMMWGAVGLASTVKDPGGELRPGILHVVGLFAVVLPSLAFVAAPFVVVSFWLLLDFVVETLAYPLAWVTNRFKPVGRRTRVNRPQLLWKLS